MPASLIQAWTMSKHFRPWNIDRTLLLPPNVRDFVPKDHVSRFIVGLVRESLDLKAIMGSYVSGLGQPPFDPRMMVAGLSGLWLLQRTQSRSARSTWHRRLCRTWTPQHPTVANGKVGGPLTRLMR